MNNYHGKDIFINKKPVQVKSQLHTKVEKYLTIRPNFQPEDYYFLVIDDMPIFYVCGYIQAKDCQKYGIWTNQNIPDRPHFWKIPLNKLKQSVPQYLYALISTSVSDPVSKVKPLFINSAFISL